MKIGFHYYALYLLMLRMGLNKTTARNIARCSQYVDDATESSPFRLERPDKSVIMFDPCCTAHKGLQFVLGINPDMQRKIYIPFHFLPLEHLLKGKRTFDWRVGPDGIFSRELVKLMSRWHSSASVNAAMLGIVLHIVADTYAHAGFSGRSGSENVVECAELQGAGAPRWSAALAAMTPPIGHAKLMDIPDMPSLRWRAKRRPWRDNADTCRAALIACGDIISRRMGMPNVSFKEEWVEPILEHLVTDKWPEEAVQNPYVDLATAGLKKKAPLVRDRDGAPSVTFTQNLGDDDFGLFVGFHIAAWHVRRWVLERIPHNL